VANTARVPSVVVGEFRDPGENQSTVCHGEVGAGFSTIPCGDALLGLSTVAGESC